MSEDDNEKGGVGVVGGVASAAGGVAVGAGVSGYMGKRMVDSLPEKVKAGLTKEKIEAAEKAAETSFEKIRGKDAESYAKKVADKAKPFKKYSGEVLEKKLADSKLEEHFKASINEQLKKDSTPEKIMQAGKKAHIEDHFAESQKSMLNAIEKDLGKGAKGALKGKDAEAITAAAEKKLANSTQYVKGGMFGKVKAGFKGMSMGGQIATALGAVAAGVAIGAFISNMRGGHADQVIASRDNSTQVSPAR